jgi:sugar transferase EpsL
VTPRDRFVKRVFDVLVASAALVALSPVLAALALLVRWKLGSPVLFRQTRPGLHGTPFTILKFRTMRDDRGQDGRPLPDEQRLTRFGHFLRSSSLDELPELVNVIKGEMSLVGPRPLIMAYLDRYTREQARRHQVRPGITGLAQVSGRNAISWEERLALDVAYIDRWSFTLDLWIMWQTLLTALRREGISAEGHATMPEFMGTRAATAEDERRDTPPARDVVDTSAR